MSVPWFRWTRALRARLGSDSGVWCEAATLRRAPPCLVAGRGARAGRAGGGTPLVCAPGSLAFCSGLTARARVVTGWSRLGSFWSGFRPRFSGGLARGSVRPAGSRVGSVPGSPSIVNQPGPGRSAAIRAARRSAGPFLRFRGFRGSPAGGRGAPPATRHDHPRGRVGAHCFLSRAAPFGGPVGTNPRPAWLPSGAICWCRGRFLGAGAAVPRRRAVRPRLVRPLRGPVCFLPSAFLPLLPFMFFLFPLGRRGLARGARPARRLSRPACAAPLAR